MAYVFKIKLEGSSKPPIWRKVKVKESLTFLDLHWVIQGVFGWYNSHLHEFTPKGWGSYPGLQENHGVALSDLPPFSKPKTWPHGERYDCGKIKLKEYFNTPKQKIVYIYDLGDHWQHTVVLEEVTEEKIRKPVCLGGKEKDPDGGLRRYVGLL